MGAKLTSVFLVVLLLLSGCGSGGSGSDPDPSQLAGQILEQVEFESELTLIAADAVENWYFLNDAVEDYVIYINAGVVPAEEIAVLKTGDPANLDQLEAILDARLESLSTSFQNYQPAELSKIDNPIRAAKGGVAVLVLTADPNAQKTVEALLG